MGYSLTAGRRGATTVTALASGPVALVGFWGFDGLWLFAATAAIATTTGNGCGSVNRVRCELIEDTLFHNLRHFTIVSGYGGYRSPNSFGPFRNWCQQI